jgi:2'-5' RNA ligase
MMPFPAEPAEGHLRAFFALSLSCESLNLLSRLRDRLVNKIPAQKFVRATPDASLHLTLKFLGDIPEAQVPSFADVLSTAKPAIPLTVTLGQLLAFGSPRHARVVGVELLETTGELLRCVQTLEAFANTLGIAAESRAFIPHITLARLHEPQDVRAFLEHMKLEPLPIHFDALRLFQSKLTPKGSQYHMLAEQRLPSERAL